MKKKFQWLLERDNSCILEKAIEYLGVEEFPGEDRNNPLILMWATEVNKDWYDKDELAWCGIFMSFIVQSCGYEIPEQSNRALSWIDWGEEVNEPQVGDILIYKYRGIRGHIGLFIEEDGDWYYTLGGNQSSKDKQDAVTIKKLRKSKCVRICRPVDIKIENNETSKDQEGS